MLSTNNRKPCMNTLSWPEINQPLSQLAQRIRHVSAESVTLLDAAGRVLAEDLVADRDSPAADVSAMDGFALRIAQLSTTGSLRIAGQSVPGSQPPQPQPGAVMQVFTGAIVPSSFDLVVRREDTIEEQGSIQLLDAAKNAMPGDHIRRQGENLRQGKQVIRQGTMVTAPSIAAAANFGTSNLHVARRIRVSILTTGDELYPVEAAVSPWQLRDSNGPTLHALFNQHRFLDVNLPLRVSDDPPSIRRSLMKSLENSDAVFLTGGVSMGDFDFVPDAVRQCGGEIVFHKLPIRPGKPILGAIGPEGQLVIGLPGNSVSASVCALRFGLPCLAKMAGVNEIYPPSMIMLTNSDAMTSPLHWFRLVVIVAPGVAELVASHGSGDLVSLAKSRGFVHLPPGVGSDGRWPFWSWTELTTLI